jgi:cytochrome c-type biogenesis protein CcmH/NrfG
LGDLDEASAAYAEGLKLEPNNEQIKQGLADVNAKKSAASGNILSDSIFAYDSQI